MESESAKKKIERNGEDTSQKVRLVAQLVFVAINVWVGVQFYLWVAAMERGVTPPVPRPAGVDGWLPIAGMMNLKAWATSGVAPSIHPAAAVLFLAFLSISLLLRKAFCSWLCPIGTLSEQLWKFGSRFLGRNLEPPRWIDIPLRSLKYLLLAFFAFAVVRMSAADIRGFMETPYGVIADVKLLNFFRFIGTTGLVVLALIALLSMAIKNFWCRYLCPYGALLGLAALASPTSIVRNPSTCIDCSKCTKACPNRLPVERLARVRSAECTLCMSCVAVCPVKGALDVKVVARRRLSAGAIAAIIATIFFSLVVVARLSGHWASEVPHELYSYLVARASEFGH